VFKCRLARYLTKSKLSIFLFFWWGDTSSFLCLRPLTGTLSTHNSTQTALVTNPVCCGQKPAPHQSRAVYCLCVLAVPCTVTGSVFVYATCAGERRNMLKATLTDLVPGGHLALLLPTPSRTKTVTTGAHSAQIGTCLLRLHGSFLPLPLLNSFQSLYIPMHDIRKDVGLNV
jgi:hypothetical protein